MILRENASNSVLNEYTDLIFMEITTQNLVVQGNIAVAAMITCPLGLVLQPILLVNLKLNAKFSDFKSSDTLYFEIRRLPFVIRVRCTLITKGLHPDHNEICMWLELK